MKCDECGGEMEQIRIEDNFKIFKCKNCSYQNVEEILKGKKKDEEN